MKVTKLCLIALFLRDTDATALRGKDNANEERMLAGYWYPVYTGNYLTGYCTDAGTPNGVPSYATELACCDSAFPDQSTGVCYSHMANPPAT